MYQERQICESNSPSMSRICPSGSNVRRLNNLVSAPHDIAQNLLVSLSGSFQTSPTFWVDPKNRVSYQIATQSPQYRTDSLQELVNIPVTGANPSAAPSLMASLVSVQRGTGMAVVSHYNVAPVIDIFGAASGRDLGGVAGDLNKIIDDTRGELPRGSRLG